MADILLLGATGMVGSQIADALLERGASLRAVIREGGYEGEKAEAVQGMRDRGMETVEADIFDADSLAPAVEGIGTVVSALQGLEDVIVTAQSHVLKAAHGAGVRRMIPSDFSVDLYRFGWGLNRNLDLRREFGRRLDASDVQRVSVLNGCFSDMFLFGFPILDAEAGTFDLWGDGETKMDFTSVADTARFTAAVAMDGDAMETRRVAGDELTGRELHEVLQAWVGKPLALREKGDADALAAHIAELKVAQPGEKGSGFPPWQAFQYHHNMITGDGKLDPLDNHRYPDAKPEGLLAFLKGHDVPQQQAA